MKLDTPQGSQKMEEARQKQEQRESELSLSQWQLMWRAFKRHRLAIGASVVLIIFYLVAITCGFVAPQGANTRNRDYIFAPPQIPKFIDNEGNFHFRPFVNGVTQEMDEDTWERYYVIDEETRHPIYFFTEGSEYKFLGLFETNKHLFGTGDSDIPIFIFGTDDLGRDVFSRIIYGTRISLSIGLVGVFLSLLLGLLLGGASGFFGGVIDLFIQRIIEILISIPPIPLWMALSAALPAGWSPIRVYFAITIILSLRGWVGVARVVRGKFLSLRDEDFVLASEALGGSNFWMITRHLVPNFMSYVLVNITLAIPWMILSETSLSFLGIGLRPPVVSWGVLLQKAQNMRTVSSRPWLLIPGVFVVIVVLSFNFVGDGLRDAADPYSD
ncbi:MAG: ABC transporter permease [Halanaerobiales bacterium]